MATLVDELVNDFAASEDEDEISQNGDQQDYDSAQPSAKRRRISNDEYDMQYNEADENNDDDEDGDTDGDLSMNGDAPEETAAHTNGRQNEPIQIGDMRSVSKFMQKLEPTMDRIADFTSRSSEQQARDYATSGLVEGNPEYDLLTDANNLSQSIDDQAVIVHKYIRDRYSVRFPELETLLPDAMEYTKAVSVIGNGPMENIQKLSESTSNPLGQPLNTVLSRPKVMTITVEATATKGHELSGSQLQSIQQACKTMLRLEHAKKILIEYVQSRMEIFAPNLTKVVGSLTAAQLLNSRGGLKNLANTRAANVASIGSKNSSTPGWATNVGVRQQGFLYETQLVRQLRPELRTQAMRIVAGKLCLAARVDLARQSLDGAVGEDLRQQCEKRLDDLIKPPPNKGNKALPAPDDKPSKKRGGRKARKAKERNAMTEVRKAQNRMAFGKEEQEVGFGTGEGTVGLGMIGQRDDGRIRKQQLDDRTRAKMSKKTQKRVAEATGGTASSLNMFTSNAGASGLRTSGIGTSLNTSGTASTITFTPNQGLELVDPKARAEVERKNKADADRWFKGGTFTQIGTATDTASKQSDGFKVPALPPKK